MTITPYDSAPLTEAETSDLSRFEETIEQHKRAFYEVGTALATIRDGRLYRATHPNFDTYCRERWDFDRTYAHRLIESADVVERLLPIGNSVPANEAQARALGAFDPEDQPRVWRATQEATGAKPPTAAQITTVGTALLHPETIEESPVLPTHVPQYDDPSLPLAAPTAIVSLPSYQRMTPEEIAAAQPAFDAFLVSLIPDNLRACFRNILNGLRSVGAEVNSSALRNVAPAEMAAVLSDDEIAEVEKLLKSLSWVQALASSRRHDTGIRRVK